MNKKDRKLTSAEQKRKADFERICEDMEQKGYLKKNLTVGVLKANIMAVIVMLPLVVVAFVAYLMINPIDSIEFFISFPEDIVFFAAFILLVILHEAIHGLTWGIFAKGHRKAIAVGFIWKMITPYCTCTEPLAKWQ